MVPFRMNAAHRKTLAAIFAKPAMLALATNRK
jgi:hypothetical protein